MKYHRKIATLLATVRWLEVTATDDALELFDVFMASELVGRAARTSDKAKLRRVHGQARHAGVLSAAVQVLFEAESWGEAAWASYAVLDFMSIVDSVGPARLGQY